MVILGKTGNKTLSISIKSNCLTLSISSTADTQVFSFDHEGRLWTAMFNSVSYRRGLDGKIVAKWIIPTTHNHQRRWLSRIEGEVIEQNAHKTASWLLQTLKSGQIQFSDNLPQAVFDTLNHVIEFTPKRYKQDINRYYEVYKPIGILPPDQYMAVFLQATEGCSFNTCTFCDFYKDRNFRIKSPDEFFRHVEAVLSYLGKGISLRRTIFLGDANALITPMPLLREHLKIVHRFFDVSALGGIYAFLDGFSGTLKSLLEYQELAQFQIKRIYIGLESGNADLLKLLKKPSDPEKAIGTVQAIKTAGIAVGVIILLGAGGHKYSAAHIEDTIKVINEMKLNADDIIYFSELVESEGLAYTKQAYQEELKPMTSEERVRQGEEIESRLIFPNDSTPHIARYDIREFVY